MKLNIDELITQAGGEFYAETYMVNGKDAHDFVEAFARLIVERCATIVQENADECSRDSMGWLVLNSNSAAIRSLLEAE